MQSADVLYYASGGYYAAVTLYQFWPVEVDGKSSTLVWRGDLISSAELADLRGVERLGSESALLRDVAKSVRALRSDSSQPLSSRSISISPARMKNRLFLFLLCFA